MDTSMQNSVRSRRARVSPKSSSQHQLRIATLYITLLVLAMIFLAPFVWLILTALKSSVDLGAYPIHWLPAQAQWTNLEQALTSINFGTYLVNSLILSSVYAVLVTLSSACVGFGFARLRGPAKGSLFTIMLTLLMLPQIMTIIPTYVLFARIHLINTYWPWVLWGLGSSPYMSFLFRQFFSSIPGELEEAAIIDGCRYGRIFWQIFLPLSTPVIATVLLFSFTGVWGDYITPQLFLNANNTTLSVAVSTLYADGSGLPYLNLMAAGAIFYMLPEVLLFLMVQRFFIRGIVTTGLKG